MKKRIHPDLIIGAVLTMLDGIRAVLAAEKTPEELERSISKSYGEDDFYLEKNREYRSERNIYTDYTREEREKLFGTPPSNVWENFKAWTEHPELMSLIADNDELILRILESYRVQMTYKWAVEYHDRYLPNSMDVLRSCVKIHGEDISDYDIVNWNAVTELKNRIGRDEIGKESMLMQVKKAIEREDWEEVSRLELEIEDAIEELAELYRKYKENIF